MSTVAASSSNMAPVAPTAPAALYSIQEITQICTSEQTFDLPMIQKLHRSIEHHGYNNIPRFGYSLAPFFNAANNGALFPPSQDPDFNIQASKPKNVIKLSSSKMYIYSMFAQCAPTAATSYGNNACKGCQNGKSRRYRSCRQVSDGQGNWLMRGACMACNSTNHGGECSFVTDANNNAPGQAAGNEDDEASADEEQTEATFDLEQYHHLSTTNKFDLEVQVVTVFPLVVMASGESMEAPAGFYLRVGVRIPGTDTHQIDIQGLPVYGLKAEGHHLRSSVQPTPDTDIWAASPAGLYVPAADFHPSSTVRPFKTIICGTLAGDPLQLAAGSILVLGETQCLPGFAVLQLTTGDDDASSFIPLPTHLMNQHLAQGTFEYADVMRPLRFFGSVDFTTGEVLHNANNTCGRNIVACGPQCQSVVIDNGEQVHVVVEGTTVPLYWGRNSRGELFVHAKQT